MRATRRDEPAFAERACLVQAKRLYRRGTALDLEHYLVDLTQVKDIAAQTTSSFLLLVDPGTEVVMPIIPARLFLDRYDEGQKTRQIGPEAGARLGRSMASWLVYEVIGLWTGDPCRKVVERALGRPGAE